MEKHDILYLILSLNNTLLEAMEYVKQNSNTDTDLTTILADMKEALKTISAKASAVLNQENAAEIRQSANALQNACDTLMRNRGSAHAFSARCHEWRQIVEKGLFIEAINAANASGVDNDRAAAVLELVLACEPQQSITALAGFSLCRKLSKQEPLRAYQLGMGAFALLPSLCASITPKDSHIHNYVFKEVEDVYFETCPICHQGKGTPYFCALPLFMANFTPLFNPVKLWMQCDACGQLFAYNFPRRLAEPKPEEEELGDEIYMYSRPQFLPIMGRTLKQILSYAKGKRLLEVGAGTGELIAAALEYGCEVEAVEISARQAQRLRNLLGVDVHCMDFLKYDTAKRFDIITMGDVLEHVTDPVAAIRKARGLLDDGGILWLSTPNFQSGFSRLTGYNDPMWNEPWHITYFNYDGLQKLLSAEGFTVLEYDISPRYNGSMELTARKD